MIRGLRPTVHLLNARDEQSGLGRGFSSRFGLWLLAFSVCFVFLHFFSFGKGFVFVFSCRGSFAFSCLELA